MPIFEPEAPDNVDPFDTAAVQAAAQRRLQAQQVGAGPKDTGRTALGAANNAYEGAQRGSIGGPWGALGGAVSEGLIGLVGGQKAVDKWRNMTPGPESIAKAKKAKKAYDDATALETSDTMGSNTTSDLGEGSESMMA